MGQYVAIWCIISLWLVAIKIGQQNSS